MPKQLSKEQKTLILIASVIAVVISLIAAWLFYQYETLNSPGTSHNQETVRDSNTKIPSVSGQGHVPGDDFIADKNGDKTDKDKDSSDSSDPSRRTSSDPIYTSPNGGQGSGEYSHNIDASCFTAEQDRIGRQLVAQQEKEQSDREKSTENKITKLISDIDKAKSTIRAHDKGYEDTGYTPNRSAKRPTKPYKHSEVKAYAQAWTDVPFVDENGNPEAGYTGHDFIGRYNNIVTADVKKENAIIKKYSSHRC